MPLFSFDKNQNWESFYIQIFHFHSDIITLLFFFCFIVFTEYWRPQAAALATFSAEPSQARHAPRRIIWPRTFLQPHPISRMAMVGVYLIQNRYIFLILTLTEDNDIIYLIFSVAAKLFLFRIILLLLFYWFEKLKKKNKNANLIIPHFFLSSPKIHSKINVIHPADLQGDYRYFFIGIYTKYVPFSIYTRIVYRSIPNIQYCTSKIKYDIEKLIITITFKS